MHNSSTFTLTQQIEIMCKSFIHQYETLFSYYFSFYIFYYTHLFVLDNIAYHEKRYGVSYFEYMGFPGRLKYLMDWFMVRLKYKSFVNI